MKLSKILNLVAVAALVAFSAVGCRKGLQKPTPLPNQALSKFGDETPSGVIDTSSKTPDNNVPQVDLNPPPVVSNVPPGGNGLNNNGGPTSAPIPKPADGNPSGNIPVPGNLADWVPAAEQPFRSETVLFDFDKSNVRPSEIPKLQRVANDMKNYQGKAIRVEGHCDARGTEEYNRALGERRALSIREHLVRLGVDASKIDTISYGEDRPVDPSQNETAHAKNRRGEFILLNPPGTP